MDTIEKLRDSAKLLNEEYARLCKFGADDEPTKNWLETRKNEVFEAAIFYNKKLVFALSETLN